MFTFKWIRAVAVLSLTLLLAFPTFGQKSGAGYDRMDGNFIKPSTRTQPKRNFNLATQERASSESSRRVVESRSATSATRSRTWHEDDREESRESQGRTSSRNNSQADSDGRGASDGTEVAPSESGESVKTTEASDVVVEQTTVPAERPAPVDENQLVYCSKRLLEFHWDAACSMLKNVKPTRLTYKVAKEGGYVECIYCGAKR